MFKKTVGLVLVAALIIGASITFTPAQPTEAGAPGESELCFLLGRIQGMCDAGDAYACYFYENLRAYTDSLGWCGPGPDMAPLTSDAVVGIFTANTELLVSPGGLGSGVVMEVGKTAWVLGVDSTGMYYKVLVSGQAAWVPVGSMAPNFDDVWNGAPLPTTVVD